MQPDDLSLPRADNKIKEKLNLHVKKRLLQDPAKYIPPSSSKIPPQPITCPVVVSPSAAVAPPPAPPASTPKTKKQKTKHSPASASTSSSAGSGQTVQLTIGTLGSLSSRPAAAAAESVLLSPGGAGGNSNDSSFNSVEADPDASNDGQAGTSGGEKAGGGSKASSSKPDIFTLILNEKKASLMRDPEVIKFLNDIVKERNKS